MIEHMKRILGYCSNEICQMISNKYIYSPKTIRHDLYMNMLKDDKTIHELIYTNDNEILDACFINSFKRPSYSDDYVIVFSHGNSGWIGSVYKSSSCRYLTTIDPNISVFIYDYRGYGMSTGRPSDDGMMSDITNVCDFLIKIKNVDPNRIVLFGNSLGTSITLRYITHAITNNESPINKIILQNPFYTLQKVFDEKLKYSGILVKGRYDSSKYVEYIDQNTNDMNICIIYSENDTMIDKSHSIELYDTIKHNEKDIIMVQGTHGKPIHNDRVKNHIKSMCFM